MTVGWRHTRVISNSSREVTSLQCDRQTSSSDGGPCQDTTPFPSLLRTWWLGPHVLGVRPRHYI